MNIRSYKRRTIYDGQRVFVYRNLHQACWSVRATNGRDSGLVIAHADEIAMRDVDFVVNESGRQRVLSEGRKNVHAGIVGEFVADEDWYGKLDSWVRYDPRQSRHFMADGYTPVVSASEIWLDSAGRVHAAGCRKPFYVT